MQLTNDQSVFWNAYKLTKKWLKQILTNLNALRSILAKKKPLYHLRGLWGKGEFECMHIN